LEFTELAARNSKNAIQADIERIDDLGNFHLVSTNAGHLAKLAGLKLLQS